MSVRRGGVGGVRRRGEECECGEGRSVRRGEEECECEKRGGV